MNTAYSSEKNIQILIALLKKHGIKKVVACPGGTNMMLNASLMYDGGFEMYSSDDERSAAYIATGLCQESKEPVVITCTGATASRNFMPGLTEAFYRKLPILVITGSQDMRRYGNLHDQIIDRSQCPNDIVKYSIHIPTVRDDKDFSYTELKINQAISALTFNGGGPSHINLETIYSQDMSITTLPVVRVIKRVDVSDVFPQIPSGKIAVYVGSHIKFSQEETSLIDTFCENHNAVVFCDHTSNYKGRFRQVDALLTMHGAQCLNNISLLIHIGEVSGNHFSMGAKAYEVWRISEDGQFRDRFGRLTHLFNMDETIFFKHYENEHSKKGHTFLNSCKAEYAVLLQNIQELPFSNIWMAKQMHNKLPEHCCVHFAILTSLRSWNFFEVSNTIDTMSNVGGFGTDGMLSSLLGASLCNPKRLYFGVVGDLAFFYDFNTIGNRHLGKNVRILLVNNGKGCEFTHHLNAGHIFKDDVNPFISAAGHFGNQSPTLVHDFAKNLGLKYLTASTKEEFLANMDEFMSPTITSSYIFEVFTHDYNENEALKIIASRGTVGDVKETIKDELRNIVGEKGVSILKSFMGK